jgi:phage-related baseplate assembly protein
MNDLSLLPAPDAIRQISFEVICDEIIADIVSRAPQFAEALTLQAEPMTILVQAFAYREMVLRAQCNDLVKSRMLAFAAGADLDHIAAGHGIERLNYENDSALRGRVVASFDAKSTAGASGTYRLFAMSASGDVKDVQVVSPAPGAITIYVLSALPSGLASAELIDTVSAAVNADHIRPMNDVVTVMSASIVEYQIDVTIYVFSGPDSQTIKQSVIDKLQAYADETETLSSSPYRSGIVGCCMRPGVRNANVTTPTADISDLAPGQVARCTEISVSMVIV